MMHQNLIEKIDEITKQNKEFTRGMNEKLNLIRGDLTKKTEDVEEAYDRGLNDAWEIAKKITFVPKYNGGFDIDDVRDIFGSRSISIVLCGLTGVEAMAKVKEYEERRKKEAPKFKRGDVVMVHNHIYPPDSRLAVYLGESEFDYDVLYNDYNISQCVGKENYSLTKTGKHIDLSVE